MKSSHGRITLLFVFLFLAGCADKHDDLASGPTFAVSGSVTYQDKVYVYSDKGEGFITGNQPYKSVRLALVDLVRVGNGEVAATTATDLEGHFRFEDVPQAEYTLRVLSQTNAASGFDITVGASSSGTYAVTRPVTVAESDVALDLAIPIESYAGAYNILDAFVSASQFVRDISGDSFQLPSLSAFWGPNSPRGSYTCVGMDIKYCIWGSGIYVLGSAYNGAVKRYDTDGYDDDVLWHEFGHYIEHALAINDSPGGWHTLTDNQLDMRLAWSEGLGNYFTTAVKTWLRNNDPLRLSVAAGVPDTYYIDTAGEDLVAIAIDLANPSNFTNECGSSDCFIHSTNEVAVATSLIRLANMHTAVSVWSTLSQHVALSPWAANLETFWDGWIANPAHTSRRIYQDVLGNRQIDYREDDFEAAGDNDSTEALSRAPLNCTKVGSCLLGEAHTLYRDDGVPDEDWIAISVTQGLVYTILAGTLKNGADPYLQLFDGSGQLLAENDDKTTCVRASECSPVRRNDGIVLSAEIPSFAATAPDTWYIRVSSTPSHDHTSFAGRYGNYTLSITASSP